MSRVAQLLLCAALCAPQVVAARMAAFADVHGAYHELTTLLREQNVIDDAGQWRAGTLELVSLGDLIDRGDEGRKVLDLLMRLQTEASAAGGRVHVVLGNHELMNLTGELDYVSRGDFGSFAADETPGMRLAAFERIRGSGRWPDADAAAAQQEFDKAFPPGYFGRLAAFSPDGVYGRWLLEQPIVLQKGATLLAHGGLPPVLAREAADLLSARLVVEVRDYAAAWHQAMSIGLIDPDTPFRERVELAGLRARNDADRQLIERLASVSDSIAFTPAGPAWYRGQALCHPAYEEDVLTAALAKQAATRVIVGHTLDASRRVLSRFDGRVILADAGMLRAAYKGRGALVYVDGDTVEVAYAGETGTRPPLIDPVSVGSRPGAIGDVELAARLKAGTVVGGSELADGREQIDVAIAGETSVSAATIPSSSSGVWRADHELVAYTLDRLLDLRLIPVTVERQLRGVEVVVQFLPAGVVSYADRQARGDNSQGWCPLQAQYELMMTFDGLIGMGPRNPRLIGFTANDPMLVLTGHGEAFTTSGRLPEYIRSATFRISKTMTERMRKLDATMLQSSLPTLSKRQISALLKRRDALVERSLAADVAHHE